MALCGSPSGLTPWDGCPPTVADALQAYAGVHEEALDPMQQSADDLPPLFVVHGDGDTEVPVTEARGLSRQALTVDGEAHVAILSGLVTTWSRTPMAAAQPVPSSAWYRGSWARPNRTASNNRGPVHMSQCTRLQKCPADRDH